MEEFFAWQAQQTLLKPKRVHQISYGGVANLMHPYPLCWTSSRHHIIPRTPLPRHSPKTQEPDRKETGRALVSLIAAAARRFGRQRSGFMFIEQLAYPIVTDFASTAISCHQAAEAYTSLDTLTALHYGC